MNLQYQYFESIDSTNNEIKRIAGSAPEGTVISAGMQTAGRGRSGHSWESPNSDSISTSILLYPKVQITHVSRLTILAAVAVADAIEDLYNLPTQIKWPNDVLLRGKKICGILTEMDAMDNQIQSVVVGIGVNVHQASFPEEIRNIATSIDLELESTKAHRKALTESIWNHFNDYYEKFEETEDLSFLLTTYENHLVNINRTVRILDPAGEYTALCMGIDETGALLVKQDDGTTQKIDSGEVSVRGIYGYV